MKKSFKSNSFLRRQGEDILAQNVEIDMDIPHKNIETV